jgi:hypothetical protein
MGTATGVGSLVLSVCGYVISGFLAVLAATIIVWIWRGKMDLSNLLNEGNGQASMSRFQLLIFTFVIAISLFELVEKSPDNKFPDIPQGVLTLLGISASTYAVGKGISYSQPKTLMMAPTDGNGGGQASASADQAAAQAGQAAAQASDARHAANVAQAAVDQIAGHMETVQQAVALSALSAAQAAAQAATSQQAADDVQTTAAQMAGHVAVVQQAVEQSAQSAAVAQQAADRATGTSGTAIGG